MASLSQFQRLLCPTCGPQLFIASHCPECKQPHTNICEKMDEKWCREFLVRANRARERRYAAKQRPPGISDKEWARRQIVAAANAKRARNNRDRAAGEGATS